MARLLAAKFESRHSTRPAQTSEMGVLPNPGEPPANGHTTGAHGNMLFEPAHTRLAGAWDINKGQNWLLAAIHDGRLSLDGLVTHRIGPEGLGEAYEGLLHKKEEYLGVTVRWK